MDKAEATKYLPGMPISVQGNLLAAVLNPKSGFLS
jgi:hypothetical protein